jgi:threonine dehydratase
MATASFADVFRAARRIAPYVLRTPLERSAALSDALGVNVWLKLECLQRTGSFKLRGAVNALLLLDDRSRQQGVVTASAGNHGLGVARAAQLAGVAATVVVPETASPTKVEALRRSGARLVLHGQTYDEAERHAIGLASERRLRYVSAYNDPAVIAGGGTLAVEVFEDLPGAGVLVAPAGGGGLLSGVGVATRALRPEARLYGAQSAASPALHAALAAGRAVTVDVHPSLADGLAGNVEPESITLDLIRQHVDDIVLVEESHIAEAMRTLLDAEHLLVEGSAAVTLAALQRGLIPGSGDVVLVLTGRNVTTEVVSQVLANR